jgi:arylsulfatase A-like enzyme
MDVHHPYLAPEPYFDMFAAAGGNYRTENGPMPDLSPEDLSYTRALYDGEIRFLDEKLRSLFAFLDSSPSMKNSVVIFMADHGEEFHEHGGMGHGTSLYGELVNIPLMIVASGALDAATHDINDPVRGVDVMPTILEIAGMSIPPNVDGRSLLARVRGRELAPAASLAGVISRGNGDRLFSISHNGYRYIHNLTQGYGELYNVSRDPLNQNNLVDSNPEIAAEMKATLMRRVAGFVAVGDTESEEPVLDKETLENLEALGYL